jgi:hypothetical protein
MLSTLPDKSIRAIADAIFIIDRHPLTASRLTYRRCITFIITLVRWRSVTSKKKNSKR